MSFLRASTNYVWCTTSVLGKGATAAVYQGVNKTNGEPVAVKTFNQLSHMRPQNVQMREFEVLKKVKHENIVKLHAIEEEQDGRGNVIVMELCTGGSLFNILDDPENTYGLEEKEFLLVLEHLAAGMKHLRDNNLVHRDLKPGNIMKFIADDGSTIYKLTDFGAARELQEGQQFHSLYGTEEYLHPDMYARAVLRKTEGKTFGATVDLWSIGVTLYHVATGNLPFRPYGGRRNKEIMFHITTKKASGVISGIQTKENGPIEWRRELPTNCHLSAGLKKFITPLLAGLLEADPKKIWTFERFFHEVTDLLSRKAISVFHVNKAGLIKVYVHPDERYEQLQNYLTEQTGITGENQIILMEDEIFGDLVRENSRAEGYPTTSEQEPLILFSKENNNVEIDPGVELPKFTEFQNLVSVDNDASKAKDACSLGYVCKRRIEKAALHTTLINKSVEYFSLYITNELKKLFNLCQHLTEIYESRKETAEAIYFAQKAISESEIKITNHVENLTEISENFVKEIKPRVQQLHEQNVVENKLKLEWEYASRLLKCPARTKAPAKVRTEVERLRESWQHLVRDRATRTLSYNDEQFHNLERIKIMETVRRIRNLLENEVEPAYTQFADNLGDWYKIAQTIYLQTMILNKDVACFDQRLEEFHGDLLGECVQFKEDMKNLVEQKARGKVTKVCQNSANYANEQLNLSFYKLVETKEEIMTMVTENNQLVEEINTLCEKFLDSTLVSKIFK